VKYYSNLLKKGRKVNNLLNKKIEEGRKWLLLYEYTASE